MKLSRFNPGSGRRDPRVLHLKLRVVLTRRMTADAARLLLHRAIETGIVPPGIEIRWIDWAKEGSEGIAGRGRIRDDIREALRQFYDALTVAGTRFEKVK